MLSSNRSEDVPLDLLQDALHAAHIGYWSYEPATQTLTWSEGMYALYELSPRPASPTLQFAISFFAAHSRPQLEAAVERAVHEGTPWDLTLEFLTARGQSLTVRTRGQCQWQDGHGVRLHGLMQAVTQTAQPHHDLRFALARTLHPIASWECLASGAQGRWDALMYWLHGLTPNTHALTLDDLASRMHVQDAPGHARALDALRTQSSPQTWEYRINHPEGHVLHLRTCAQARRDAQGDVQEIVGLTVDITDERRTTEQLHEALWRLRIATEAAGVGTFERDLTTGTGRWDSTMPLLWGMPPNSPTPSFEQALTRVLPQDRAIISKAMEQVTEVDHAVEFEYRIRRADGRVNVLSTRALAERDGHGVPLRIVGATMDVSASREAQVRLREFNEWMQLSTQATGVGFFRVNMQGVPLYADAQLRIHLGLAPEGPPLTEGDLHRHVLPEDAHEVRRAHEAAAQSHEPVEAEYRVRDPQSGTIRYLFTRRVRIDAHDERGPSIVGAVLDVSASRAAQRALATTSERLALATRTAGVGIWEWNLLTDEEVWDARMREIYGVTDAQAKPTLERWRALVHPDDRHRAAEPFTVPREALADGESEYRIVRPDGEVRTVMQSYVVERNSAGIPVRMLGTDLDITEARRAQSERDTLSRRLELIASEVGIGVWDWDIVRNTTVWNEQMYALFGRTRDTFADRNWLDFVHEHDRERAQADVHRALRQGDLLQSRFRVIWPNGQVRWIASRARIERNALGAPTRMVGVHWDVTDLLRADEERQQLSERINIAAAGARIGFWHFVLGSDAAYIDDQTIALYGRTRESDPDFAHHWLRYVHEDDYPRMKEAALRLTHTDEPVETEFRIYRSDGALRHLAVRARRCLSPDGRSMVINGVNWDVTEQRNAEEALRAREMAERASAAKTEFLSRMSHELRTPLNAVLGFAQIMEIDGRHPLDATQSERLGHIQKAGWHLLTLINEILDLSRIEAGKAHLSMAVVPVAEVIDECLNLVSLEAQRRDICLHNELDAHSPANVWADRVRFKQVLLNLLSNAVKYNRPGGHVHVRVQVAADHQVAIRVRDTGPGLNAAQMAEIFEPFNRLGLDATAEEGTGIGLTISLKLAQQMGGTLTVAGAPGEGCEFTLQLQAAGAHARSLEAQATAQLRLDVTGSVLYVEDNPANVTVVEEAMALRPAVKLFTARDGAAALVLAAVSQPDLALIDLRLPDTDGLALIADLHAHEATRNVPCVAVSANALETDISAARKAGFVDFWAKPLRIEQLLTGIDYWLTRPHP